MKKEAPLTYKKIISQHLNILKNLQYTSGLFAASKKESSTGYDKSWLRDNFYECLAFYILEDWTTVEKTYTALLNIFLKHEYKLDYAIASKPKYKHEYIHARFHPETFDEFWEDWGNKQNDSIGAILFMIGKLEQRNPKILLKGEHQIRIVNKLVKYLNSIEYWHDEDSGMWEMNEEVHASSVGACVSGLREVSKLPEIEVPEVLLRSGERTLNHLLPRESKTKFVDLALLSLIYPYNVVNKKQKEEILRNVEYQLLKKHGVIRYKNDHYYNKNPDGYSEEAEWCFGLSWLAIIYEHLGRREKAEYFVELMLETATDQGVPELYYSNSTKYNDNTPLGWAESLFIVALHDLNTKLNK
ncbi:glycoside hydrolase family 15 [Candidatus Woesearchaeota archaeon CG10_big_fil_rev_8_21_14_0_10_32_9]|nr:MAG: glycoside hydrolase family 15 [Candidatus Woesearchaeota archaeon CG10_big_fil_rev_8_21_14_0_10_32_9]